MKQAIKLLGLETYKIIVYAFDFEEKNRKGYIQSLGDMTGYSADFKHTIEINKISCFDKQLISFIRKTLPNFSLKPFIAIKIGYKFKSKEDITTHYIDMKKIEGL